MLITIPRQPYIINLTTWGFRHNYHSGLKYVILI